MFFRASAQRWEGWPFRAQRKFECKAIFRTRSAKIFLAYGHYILFHVYEWLEDNIPQHEDEKLLEDYQMGCFEPFYVKLGANSSIQAFQLLNCNHY